MNLSLLDPFSLAQDYPETLSKRLKWGHSCCISFNRKGDYFASGLVDGTIVIFDFDTHGVIAVLRGHSRQIQSLSWSKDGRYILSASRDWTCMLWDLSTKKATQTINFNTPVWGAQLHPSDHTLFVVSLYEAAPKLVQLDGEGHTMHDLPTDEQKDDEDSENAKKPVKHLTLVTQFDKSGKYIFAGTSRGYLNVISTETRDIMHSTRVTSSSIKNIEVSQSGRSLGINSSDRVIRQIQVPTLLSTEPDTWEFEVILKYQDVVNRLQWNSITFASNGEYMLASTFESHDVYMWETSMGSLVKIFEGPKEELTGISWHPSRPILAAIGLDSGKIFLWSTITPQRWSALAPDFVEVEENINYEEKEDEFDMADQEDIEQQRQDDEDGEVDVMTIEQIRGVVGQHESFIVPIELSDVEEAPVSDDD
ncbi:Set1 complex component swd1 [Yarrowia sp. B02]|nr:Set1 complex component swd1 [Yarrowia sp. B02]